MLSAIAHAPWFTVFLVLMTPAVILLRLFAYDHPRNQEEPEPKVPGRDQHDMHLAA